MPKASTPPAAAHGEILFSVAQICGESAEEETGTLYFTGEQVFNLAIAVGEEFIKVHRRAESRFIRRVLDRQAYQRDNRLMDKYHANYLRLMGLLPEGFVDSYMERLGSTARE